VRRKTLDVRLQKSEGGIRERSFVAEFFDSGLLPLTPYRLTLELRQTLASDGEES
jgi:hypothetical protein